MRRRLYLRYLLSRPRAMLTRAIDGWRLTPRREPAQAFTEFAAISLAALLLLVGVVDLGRVFYQAQAIHQAVGAGALVAVDPSRVTNCSSACSPTAAPCYSDTGVACANDQVKCAITAAVPWGNGGDCRTPNPDDTITLGTAANPSGPWTAADWAPGSSYTITMTHTFRFITPMLSSSKTLTLSAAMTAHRNPQ